MKSQNKNVFVANRSSSQRRILIPQDSLDAYRHSNVLVETESENSCKDNDDDNNNRNDNENNKSEIICSHGNSRNDNPFVHSKVITTTLSKISRSFNVNSATTKRVLNNSTSKRVLKEQRATEGSLEEDGIEVCSFLFSLCIRYDLLKL